MQIVLLLSMAGYTIAETAVAKKYDDKIKSSFNIYQFGRKVLAHLFHYPLARVGVLQSQLYNRRNWDSLMHTMVSRPIPVFQARGSCDLRTLPLSKAA